MSGKTDSLVESTDCVHLLENELQTTNGQHIADIKTLVNIKYIKLTINEGSIGECSM